MTDDLDEFSTPLGTGMTRCPTVPLRDEAALHVRLAAFDAMRCRGATASDARDAIQAALPPSQTPRNGSSTPWSLTGGLCFDALAAYREGRRG